MNEPRRGRVRARPYPTRTRQRVQEHSAATSWYLNPEQDDTQYNGGADHAGFPDDVFHPPPFEYYDNTLGIYTNNFALPSVSYTRNDNEDQLDHPAQGINALRTPFQTPPNITQIMGDLDVPSEFDIDSQNGQSSDKLAQLQLELANVKDSVVSLQSEVQKHSSTISTISDVKDTVTSLQSEVQKYSSYISTMRTYCSSLSEWCKTIDTYFNKGHQSRAGVAGEDRDTQDGE